METIDAPKGQQESATSKSRGKYLGFWDKDATLYNEVVATAELAEMSVSEFLRLLIQDGLKEKGRGQADVLKRLPHKAANKAAKIQLGKFIVALNRLSNNLNQLARLGNIAVLSGNWQDMPEAKEALEVCAGLHDLMYEIQQQLVIVEEDAREEALKL